MLISLHVNDANLIFRLNLIKNIISNSQAAMCNTVIYVNKLEKATPKTFALKFDYQKYLREYLQSF